MNTSIVRYYAERAKVYDRIYLKPKWQNDLHWLRQYVARGFCDANILEIACGTGYWTELIARSAATVTAVDINEEVLNIARSKNVDSRKVTFIKADAYNLPDFKKRFTVGFAAFWWSHVPKDDLRRFLRGFHRALAPNSRVVLIDNNYVDGSNAPVSRRDQWGNTYQIRELDDGSTHEVLKNFPTESELLATIDGLVSDASITTLQHDWILSYKPKVNA